MIQFQGLEKGFFSTWDMIWEQTPCILSSLCFAVPDRGKDHSAPAADRGGAGAQRNRGGEASREVFHGNPAGARPCLHPGAVWLDLQVGRAAGMGLEYPLEAGGMWNVH